MIEVRNLVKKYGDNVAVDNLSFTVEKGQIYGFLGPNGAGKSTTMNIMTGYMAATEGEVIINGHDIFEEPEEAKKCIGYLPEIPPLYMDMTVMEYLKFAAELKRLDKKERQHYIDEAVKLAKLEEVGSRLIKNLSKGYRQRVGLAQAVLGFPEIIILDEPTVGLDPKQIIEIRDLIKKLSKRHTVILSSHIMQEVSAVCDHIMIIAQGKLVASDTPENLSKLMVGANTLDLCIKGDADRVKDILKAMPDVDTIETHNSTEKDAIDVKIKTKADGDIREKVFYTLAESNLPILMMKNSNMSLEDVFLQLTAGKSYKAPEKKSLFGKKKQVEIKFDGANSDIDVASTVADVLDGKADAGIEDETQKDKNVAQEVTTEAAEETVQIVSDTEAAASDESDKSTSAVSNESTSNAAVTENDSKKKKKNKGNK